MTLSGIFPLSIADERSRKQESFQQLESDRSEWNEHGEEERAQRGGIVRPGARFIQATLISN
jgi:hypothetical protein